MIISPAICSRRALLWPSTAPAPDGAGNDLVIGECTATRCERYTAAYPPGDLSGYSDEQIEELCFYTAANGSLISIGG